MRKVIVTAALGAAFVASASASEISAKVNNKDTHSKNFSYLYRDKKWLVSPGYDITLSEGIGNEHTTTFLGEGKIITKKHMLTMASKFNIKNADTIIHDIQEALIKWPSFADMAHIPKAEAKRIGQNFVVFK